MVPQPRGHRSRTQRRTYQIRPARLADIPALLALEAPFPTDRLSLGNFRHLLTRANAQIAVCVEAGCLLADVVTLYRRNSHTARLYSLVVDPSAQGRGLATALMQRAEADARKRGCTRLCLEVRPDNARALALYERRAYVITKEIVDYYEDGSPALRLCRAL